MPNFVLHVSKLCVLKRQNYLFRCTVPTRDIICTQLQKNLAQTMAKAFSKCYGALSEVGIKLPPDLLLLIIHSHRVDSIVKLCLKRRECYNWSTAFSKMLTHISTILYNELQIGRVYHVAQREQFTTFILKCANLDSTREPHCCGKTLIHFFST